MTEQKSRVDDSGRIYIGDLNKAAVLAALFNNAKAQGMGFFQHTPGDITTEEAQELLDQGKFNFDYLEGRVMKINLQEESFNPWLYDRDNGEGAALRAVQEVERGVVERQGPQQGVRDLLQDAAIGEGMTAFLVAQTDPHFVESIVANSPYAFSRNEIELGQANIAMAGSSEIVSAGGEALASKVLKAMQQVTTEEIINTTFPNEEENFFFNIPGVPIAAKRLSVALDKLNEEGALPESIASKMRDPNWLCMEAMCLLGHGVNKNAIPLSLDL